MVVEGSPYALKAATDSTDAVAVYVFAEAFLRSPCDAIQFDRSGSIVFYPL